MKRQPRTKDTVYMHDCIAVGTRFHEGVAQLIARDPRHPEVVLAGAMFGIVEGFHDEAAKLFLRAASEAECRAIRGKQLGVTE